jgi:hypothetical protein
MSQPTEPVRITPAGQGFVHEGRPVAVGDTLRLPIDQAADVVRSGKGQYTYAVRVGRRGFLIGSVHRGAGSEVLVSRSKALEIHMAGAGEILEPSRFAPEELAKDQRGTPVDPYASEPKVAVVVLSKLCLLGGRSYCKGDIVEGLPESIAARAVHHKAVKLVRGSELSRRGITLVEALKRSPAAAY